MLSKLTYYHSESTVEEFQEVHHTPENIMRNFVTIITLNTSCYDNKIMKSVL